MIIIVEKKNINSSNITESYEIIFLKEVLKKNNKVLYPTAPALQCLLYANPRKSLLCKFPYITGFLNLCSLKISPEFIHALIWPVRASADRLITPNISMKSYTYHLSLYFVNSILIFLCPPFHPYITLSFFPVLSFALF